MASMLHAEPGAGNKTAAGKEHLLQRKGCLQAVLAILPEPEREPAWLKTQPAPRIVEGEILAGQPEGSNPLLARLQKQLAEALELAHRQCDRGNLILHIALHHRVAGPVARGAAVGDAPAVVQAAAAGADPFPVNTLGCLEVEAAAPPLAVGQTGANAGYR